MHNSSIDEPSSKQNQKESFSGGFGEPIVKVKPSNGTSNSFLEYLLSSYHIYLHASKEKKTLKKQASLP